MARNKVSKRAVCMAVSALAIALLLVYEIVGLERIVGEIADKSVKNLADMTVTRALGSAVFIAILVHLGFKVMSPFRGLGKSLLVILPAFAVVINNLPIYPLASGLATVSSPWWKIVLLAAECAFIGIFEEVCFRGVVFLSFLEKRRASTSGRFWSIVLTAAVFGAVHAVNLFFGSSPVAVLMQIGYSFLIGAMCSVVLIKTANVWLCALLHAVFDFCGALVPNCGEGIIWEPVTVTATVIVAVAVTVYMVLVFFKIKNDECDALFIKE